MHNLGLVIERVESSIVGIGAGVVVVFCSVQICAKLGDPVGGLSNLSSLDL